MNWDQKHLRNRAVLMVMFLLALAMVCSAQDSEDDEDDGNSKPYASLSLNFDPQGNADVVLWLDQKPADWEPIKEALGQVLHCRREQFTQQQFDIQETRYTRQMKPEVRAKYLQSLAAFRERQLHGKCKSVLVPSGWRIGGTLALQPFRDALSKEGKQVLNLTVRYPKTAFAEHSLRGLQQDALPQLLSYSYPLDDTAANPVFSLSYGYRRSDLLKQAAMSLGFVLFPVLIILWMRGAALKDADEDATAAWFSYFKTLQWSINATMLIWVVARTSMREGLQEIFTFHFGGHGWQAGLCRALILVAPPWISYFICLLLSYDVFVRMRGNTWKRGEFLLNQMFAVGMQALPLMFVVMGIEFIYLSPKGVPVAFAAAYFSRTLCMRGKMKLSRSAPEALTTGELRDRVFALAKKAGVGIKQIFILGAGRDQVANAYAAKNNVVMFTDYLLTTLSKREVDAVTAHELSHLQHRHPMKLGMMLMGVIISPSLFRIGWKVIFETVSPYLYTAAEFNRSLTPYWYRLNTTILNWRQMDLLVMVLGLGSFYLLARRFERIADEGSVRLTGDAEAMITALLRISRVNLTPIQWGKVTGSMLTHPSTLKRAELLARAGNVTPERLNEIVSQYQQERRVSRGPQTADVASADHYAFPDRGATVVSMIETVQRSTNNRWIMILAHAVLPSLVVLLVQFAHLSGRWALGTYLLGAVVVLAAYSWLTVLLGTRGWEKLRERFINKLHKESIGFPEEGAVLTGFAPGPQPRFYVAGYDWDIGLLFLQRNQIAYVGDKLRFALKPEQIFKIRLGQGSPGWWTSQRVYIDWQDGKSGRQAISSFLMKNSSSPTKVKQQGPMLYAELQKWLQNSGQYPEASVQLAALDLPNFGEVTSRAPKSVVNSNTQLVATFLVLTTVIGTSTVLGISPWYGIGVALLMRLYEMIPYWRYKEQALPAVQPSGPAKAKANSAG